MDWLTESAIFGSPPAIAASATFSVFVPICAFATALFAALCCAQEARSKTGTSQMALGRLSDNLLNWAISNNPAL
ncbi:hypothetical protein GCM10010909_05720 [Acidocella aquatica]|uniref:Uncharacterized protein n=1 Tax=Acidocella aquatica TaxID=1922313 RepID=A0ABQ6A700_9PROT|nr:hypothetical protein GCM10010909_05720 [Acidocella aquatica]